MSCLLTLKPSRLVDLGSSCCCCLAKPCCGPVLLLQNPCCEHCTSKLIDFVLQTSLLRRLFSACELQIVQLLRHVAAAKESLNPSHLVAACSAIDVLVGRLGFEPRQSASKALDLPLVDRPVMPGLQDLSTYRRLHLAYICEHPRPVLRSGQGLRQESLGPANSGHAVEPLAHLPRTGTVQTARNPNPRAPHTSQADPNQSPIN